MRAALLQSRYASRYLTSSLSVMKMSRRRACCPIFFLDLDPYPYHSSPMVPAARPDKIPTVNAQSRLCGRVAAMLMPQGTIDLASVRRR